MIGTRWSAAALALSLLAGCGGREGVMSAVGLGNPPRMAAMDAPWDYGRTEALAGDPAATAEAASRLEAMTLTVQEDPFWVDTRDQTLLPSLWIARRDMRRALGIPERAPGRLVSAALWDAAGALRAARPEEASARLSALGDGPAILENLGRLPRLRSVEAAAGMLATEANRNPSAGP